MKKSIVVALFCFFGVAQMNAQVSFRPGIRGGLNFSHFTKGDEYTSSYYDGNTGSFVHTTNKREFSGKTDFYIGAFGALKLSKFYTLQPEITYSRQGAIFKNSANKNEKLDVAYLSIAVANKFTFNKFNFQVGPTIDFVVEDNFNTYSEVDLAFFLGAGYDFTKNFGVEARIKKGIIPVLDYSQSSHTNVVFQVGATYTFDIK